MPQRWNQQKEIDLVAAIGVLDAEVIELRLQCKSLLESDEPWDAARGAKFQSFQTREMAAQDELARLRGDLEDLRLSKPRSMRGVRREPAAFARFLRRGFDHGLTGEEQAEQVEMQGEAGDWEQLGRAGGATFLVTPSGPLHLGGGPLGDIRMDTASDAASGQNLIDTDTVPRLVERLANFGGARRASQVIRTARGNPLRYPRIDAASQVGELVGAQGTAVAALDIPNIGYVELGAFTYSSKSIGVTVEMVQDSEFDIMGFVERQAVRRIGRITNLHFTSGDGASKPQGVVPLATTTTAAAMAGSITWQEALRIQYDIDDAYIEGMEMGMGGSPGEGGGMVGYQMSRDSERVLRSLQDLEGRPLWAPSVAAGMYDRIHNFPYVLNYDMDSVATGKKAIMFGNFAYFLIRSAMSVMVHSFWDSRTAQTHSFEVLAFCREDSDAIGPLVAAECPAFAVLTQA